MAEELLQALIEIKQAVSSLQTEFQAGNQRWIRVPAAAAYASVSERSIRGLIAAGKLKPHRPVRGVVLVDKRELDNLIESSTAGIRKGRGIRAS